MLEPPRTRPRVHSPGPSRQAPPPPATPENNGTQQQPPHHLGYYNQHSQQQQDTDAASPRGEERALITSPPQQRRFVLPAQSTAASSSTSTRNNNQHPPVDATPPAKEPSLERRNTFPFLSSTASSAPLPLSPPTSRVVVSRRPSDASYSTGTTDEAVGGGVGGGDGGGGGRSAAQPQQEAPPRTSSPPPPPRQQQRDLLSGTSRPARARQPREEHTHSHQPSVHHEQGGNVERPRLVQTTVETPRNSDVQAAPTQTSVHASRPSPQQQQSAATATPPAVALQPPPRSVTPHQRNGATAPPRLPHAATTTASTTPPSSAAPLQQRQQSQSPSAGAERGHLNNSETQGPTLSQQPSSSPPAIPLRHPSSRSQQPIDADNDASAAQESNASGEVPRENSSPSTSTGRLWKPSVIRPANGVHNNASNTNDNNSKADSWLFWTDVAKICVAAAQENEKEKEKDDAATANGTQRRQRLQGAALEEGLRTLDEAARKLRQAREVLLRMQQGDACGPQQKEAGLCRSDDVASSRAPRHATEGAADRMIRESQLRGEGVEQSQLRGGGEEQSQLRGGGEEQSSPLTLRSLGGTPSSLRDSPQQQQPQPQPPHPLRPTGRLISPCPQTTLNSHQSSSTSSSSEHNTAGQRPKAVNGADRSDSPPRPKTPRQTHSSSAARRDDDQEEEEDRAVVGEGGGERSGATAVPFLLGEDDRDTKLPRAKSPQLQKQETRHKDPFVPAPSPSSWSVLLNQSGAELSPIPKAETGSTANPNHHHDQYDNGKLPQQRPRARDDSANTTRLRPGINAPPSSSPTPPASTTARNANLAADVGEDDGEEDVELVYDSLLDIWRLRRK